MYSNNKFCQIYNDMESTYRNFPTVASPWYFFCESSRKSKSSIWNMERTDEILRPKH